MRWNPILPAVAFAVAGVVGTAVPASAESYELSATTVGSLTEQAELVVLAEAGEVPDAAADAWRFRVTERLRGDAAPGDRVEVAAGDFLSDVRPGEGYLLFLRRLEDGRHAALSRFAVRRSDGIDGLVAYARDYAAALGVADEMKRREALRSLLVARLGNRESGVPFCAGTDLVRRADLHAGVTAADRERIADALATPRRADLDLAGLLAVAGHLGDVRVDERLVALLIDPDVHTMRREVTRALARRSHPELVARLVELVAVEDARRRGNVANALGQMGARAAEKPLLALLRDEAAAVRVEAAHAVGRLARAVRARPAEAPAPGAEEAPRPKLSGAVAPLLAALSRAEGRRERKAVCWALAQVDTPEAWAALKRLRDDEAAPEPVRRFARTYLERPRVGLILR